MNCFGCDTPIEEQPLYTETTEGNITKRMVPAPAAYALMHANDIMAANRSPDVRGPADFHAVGVCKQCYDDPSHRTRQIKAHFSPPNQRQLWIMLGTAGSNSDIGG